MKTSRLIGRLGWPIPTALPLILGTFTSLAADTNIIAWGFGSLTNVPDLGTNAIAITGGDSHAIALLADRTVRTWGYFAYGGSASIVPPVDATNIVSIAAGSSHALAVRSDGRVVLWGKIIGDGTTQVPPEVTNVVAVGMGPGAQHALALRADGTVVDWGLPGLANIPLGVVNIVSVAAGSQHSLALRSDGRVFTWGGPPPPPASATNIVAIATTWSENIALRADGKLLTWSTGQTTSSNMVEVAGAGGYNASGMALNRSGAVFTTGSAAAATNIMAIGGAWGPSGTYFAVKAAGPPIFPLPAVRRTVAATQTAYLRLRAVGALPMTYQWSFQGTNLPNATNEVLVVTNALSAAAGFYSLVASNVSGVITNSEMQLVVSPVVITNQPTNQIVYVGANPILRAGVLGKAPSYRWTFNGTNIAWATNSSMTLTNIQLGDAGTYSVSVSNEFGVISSSNAIITVVPILVTRSPQDQVNFRGATVTFSIAAQASSPLSYQWQFNGTNLQDATTSALSLTNVLYEQAGPYTVLTSTTNAVVTNSAILSVVPVAAWGDNSYGQANVPANLTNIIALAGGNRHALALKADGSVVAWGDNSDGQTTLPAGMTNVVAIAAGGSHNLVLKADGTLMSWGRNDYGQTNVPPGLVDIVAIGAGSSHGLALNSTGRVIAWGYNAYGQTNVPLDLTNAIAIAAGGYHNLAMKEDGSLLVWGNNNNGQTNPPAGLTNVVGVGAGEYHSLAVKADGTVTAWGYNSYGQTNVPSDLANVAAIGAGFGHSLALKVDGTVTAWGGTSYGEAIVPTGLTNVLAIAGGRMYDSFALVGDGPPVVNGSPINPVWSNNVFSVSLVSQNHRVYRLEHKDNLSDSNWIAHPLVAGNGGTLTFTDPTAMGAQRFYRIRRW